MKNKRQGLNVSVNELRKLARDLESETRQLNLELGMEETIDFNKKWLISIINKTPECCDTWEIETKQSRKKENDKKTKR